MFTKDTRNQVSVDTNDRHLGQCIGRLTVDSRDLTKLRRRRQWERLKHNRFYEQNNNSARASRFFVNFFAVSEQLRSEMTKILSWLENGKSMAINFALSLSLSELRRGPLFSAPTEV